MSPRQRRVLQQIQMELAEAGHELSGEEVESMGQFLVLLDAAGSADGLQRTLDRLAPNCHVDGVPSLLETSPTEATCELNV